jgi:hypothetical protein
MRYTMNSYYKDVNKNLKAALTIETMLAAKLGISIAEFRNTPIVSLRARLERLP